MTLIVLSSHVLASDICQFTNKNFMNTKIQTGKFSDGNCYIFVSPKYSKDLIYRSFIFTQDGQHLIFNSYGEGPPSTFTGARLFTYLIKSPSLKLNTTGDEIIVTFDETDCANETLALTKKSTIKMYL